MKKILGDEDLRRTIPAISIIIPMYNAEKYIGECLNSILAQTFQDFEVIVVDDCSTDKSCDVVESYLPKFNRGGVEKLKLISLKKNSQSGAMPRNIGIRLSRGDYIFLMDDDDAILENALEIFYNTAENFDADIVHCNKHYLQNGDCITKDKTLLKLASKSSFEEFPHTFKLTPSVPERIDKFVERKIRWAPWTHLIRRDLLLKNNLTFPNLSIADDLLFTIKLLLFAKNIIFIPDALYIQRSRSDSHSRMSLSVQKTIHKKIGDVLLGIHDIEKDFNEIEPFANSTEYKYKLFNFITSLESGYIFPLYTQIPVHQLDELVRKEIDEIGSSTALTTFLFARMNIFNIQLIQLQQLLAQKDLQINELKQNAIKNKF